MANCPVCNVEFGEEIPEFCAVCDWDTFTDLQLSSTFPEEAKNRYTIKLKLARSKWSRIQEIEDKIKSQEEQIKALNMEIGQLRKEGAREVNEPEESESLQQEEAAPILSSSAKERIAPITKAVLVQTVAENTGISKKETKQILDTTLEIITNYLAEQAKEKPERRQSVQIIGFGKFEVKDRSERVVKEPNTQKEVTIPARSAPVFRPGKTLKAKMES